MMAQRRNYPGSGYGGAGNNGQPDDGSGTAPLDPAGTAGASTAQSGGYSGIMSALGAPQGGGLPGGYTNMGAYLYANPASQYGSTVHGLWSAPTPAEGGMYGMAPAQKGSSTLPTSDPRYGSSSSYGYSPSGSYTGGMSTVDTALNGAYGFRGGGLQAPPNQPTGPAVGPNGARGSSGPSDSAPVGSAPSDDRHRQARPVAYPGILSRLGG